MGVLSIELAQKFIDKTVKNLNFNINVMNEKGIIIASKDQSRVGDFHEVAYSLLNGTIMSGVIKLEEEEKYINTKAGVNMFIEYKHQKVGVICVTGNPNDVESFAGLVKTSMEAMLEYELQKEEKQRKKTDIEQFLYYLLFEENIEITIATSLADNINLIDDIYRIAIIVRNNSDLTNDKLVHALMQADGHSKLDLITVARNNNIVLLKYIEDDSVDEMVDYKEIIEKYFANVYSILPEGYTKEHSAVFVGTLQKKMAKYRSSFSNAQVICNLLGTTNGIHYFNNHVTDYFRNLVSFQEYENIYCIYNELFNENDREMIAETVDALNKNNYNVVNSAKELFIHRNTLVFRLNKIKNLLRIDPIANACDRDFLNEMAYYFRNQS